MMTARDVFVCGGPRCDPTRREADKLVARLREIAVEQGLAIVPARRLCMSACEHGPTLVVEPDGVWYRCADRESLERIAAEHLRDGRAVSELVFHRPA